MLFRMFYCFIFENRYLFRYETRIACSKIFSIRTDRSLCPENTVMCGSDKMPILVKILFFAKEPLTLCTGKATV